MSQAPTLHYTADGSPTLYQPALGEYYHSVHGAWAESSLIFLAYGLEHRAEQTQRPLHVLEVGFGTGLNALLTALWAEHSGRSVHYTTLEKYPLPPEVYAQLSYPQGAELFPRLHAAPWDEPCALTPRLTIEKRRADLTACPLPGGIDVVYFDAFSPEAQPELWSEEIFRALFAACAPGAILTTYCAKGEVRRRLTRAGFTPERLAGPPGKRHVLRARKP